MSERMNARHARHATPCTPHTGKLLRVCILNRKHSVLVRLLKFLTSDGIGVFGGVLDIDIMNARESGSFGCNEFRKLCAELRVAFGRFWRKFSIRIQYMHNDVLIHGLQYCLVNGNVCAR